MYLHIGRNVLICDRELLGIFDLDGKAVSRTTAAFLKGAEEKGETVAADEYGLPRSLILTVPEKGKQKLLLSVLSPVALTRRATKGGIGGEDTAK